MKRKLIIILATIFLVSATGSLLNQMSYNPNFSMLDAITSASKKSKKKQTKTIDLSWSYGLEDFKLSDNDGYKEKTLTIDNKNYTLLQKDTDSRSLTILSNKENSDYQKSVERICDFYQNQGYKINMVSSSETLFLSLAHAKHFDLLLMRKE